MNREQILMSLEDIRKQLPSELLSSEDSDALAERLVEERIKANAKERRKAAGNLDIDLENDRLLELKRIQSSLRNQILDGENGLSSETKDKDLYDDKIEEFKFKLEMAEKELASTRDDSKKDAISVRIDAFNQEIERLTEARKVSESRIAMLKDYIADRKKELKSVTSSIKEERENEVKRAKEEFYPITKRGHLITERIVEAIEGLIDDIKNNRLDEVEVGFRMTQIRDALAENPLFDDLNTEETERASRAIANFDRQINELDSKMGSDDSYLLSDEAYQLRLTELGEKLSEDTATVDSQRAVLDGNNEKIRELRESLSTLTSGEDIVRVGQEISRVETSNREIERSIAEKVEEIQKTQEEVDYLNGGGRVDRLARERDNEELARIRTLRADAEAARDLHIKPIQQRLDTILTGVGYNPEDYREFHDMGTKTEEEVKEEVKEETIEEAKEEILPNPDELNIAPPTIKEEDKDLGEDPSLVFPKLEELPKEILDNPDLIAPPIISEGDKDLGMDPGKLPDPEELNIVPPIILERDKDLGGDPSIVTSTPIEKSEDETIEPFPTLNPVDEKVDEPKPKTEVVSTKAAKPTLREKLRKRFPKIARWLSMLLVSGMIFTGGMHVQKQFQEPVVNNIVYSTTVEEGNKDDSDIISYAASEENMSALQALLDKCNAVDGSLYTEDSYNAMMDQVRHIENHLLGGEKVMSVSDCLAETAILQQLYDNLQLKKTEGQEVAKPDPEPTKPDLEPTRPDPGPTNPDPGPTNPDPGPTNPDPGPTNPDPGPTNPDPEPTNPDPEPTNPDPEPVVGETDILLAEGDSAGNEEDNTTVDYDGVQREGDTVVGETELDHTAEGLAIVDPEKDIPAASDPKPENVPTGHETTDTSDLTPGEKDNLDSAVEEELVEGDFNWGSFAGVPESEGQGKVL